MQSCLRKYLRLVVSTSLVVCSLVLAPAASFGQSEAVRISADALPQGVLAVIEQGRHFEEQNRWADALSHYEEAIRKHPDNRQLTERFDLARMHYSVERRYVDRSFLGSTQSLTAQQAAELYSDILLKIDSHYVTQPSWDALTKRGANSLGVALAKTTFLRHNGVSANSNQIAQFKQEVQTLLRTRTINSRADAVQMAAYVGQLGNSRIGLRPTTTLLEFTAAAAGGLDNYSAFLTGDQLKEIYSQIEGNFVGLGVELKEAKGRGLEIVHVIPGSPAERANIQAGDVITEIDGQNLATLTVDAAAGLLTGEEGTSVAVRVVPPHAVAKPLADGTFPATRTPWVAMVRREHVDVPALEEIKIIDPEYGVAYLRIPVFQKSTAAELETALWDLYNQGMKSLVIDLRGNPGGLLTSSVELADKFVAQGRIVSTRGRSAGEDFDYRAHRPGTWRVPLVVLIDDQSASASEIFAAAIHDNRRGSVVGERSFGKGSVQGIFPLGHAGIGIRLTTAKFYSPNGQPISEVGVQPDIVVRHASGETEGTHKVGYRGASPSDDPALSKAIETARGQLALR